jgi:hypothetical protein
LGGGAALLEIEELIGEHAWSNTNFITPAVVSGACRDYCTVGPNVHIHGHHYPHVNNPTRCADVVASLVNVEMISQNNSFVSRMATRRSERLRWEALRQVSRAQRRDSHHATTDASVVSEKKPLDSTVPLDTTCKPHDAIREMLRDATQAEMDAAGSNVDTLARAKRRSERLWRNATNSM